MRRSLAALLLAGSASALPEGFSLTTVTDEVPFRAMGLALLPDGRMLVATHRNAEVWLVVDGVVGGAPIQIVPDVVPANERGLLDIAVDPDWPDEPWVYLFYSHTSDENRVTRVRAAGTLDSPDSHDLRLDFGTEEVLIRARSLQRFHNGGTIRFGSDGTLYASHGDDNDALAFVQDLRAGNGKIFRIHRDGSIPADNPAFPDAPADARRDLFAFGLRNPFRFAIDPATDELFIADVGENHREEFDIARGGENFGYPRYEGTRVHRGEATLSAPSPTPPVYEWSHGDSSETAIALFAYRSVDYPDDASFPPWYEGALFYTNFHHPELDVLLPDGGGGYAPVDFGDDLLHAADAELAPDGSVIVLQYGTAIRRLSYHPDAPRVFSSTSVTLAGTDVCLEWSTDAPGDAFEVDRRTASTPVTRVADVPVTGGAGGYVFVDDGAPLGTVFYRVTRTGAEVSEVSTEWIRVELPDPVTFTGIAARGRPNPFRDGTLVTFQVPGCRGMPAGETTFDLFDPSGRRVRRLVGAAIPPGVHTVSWDGRDDRGREAPSGQYFYRIRSGPHAFTGRLTRIR